MERKKVLEITDLNIFFDISLGTVKAVENVSFNLYEGESLGLVGESGCGKTTTALSTMGMLPDNGYLDNGSILYEDKDIAKNSETDWQLYRWNDISMVFQGAMNALNPVKKISFQIAEAILLHNPGMKDDDVRARIVELFKVVGLDEKRVDDYPHEFSGGMRQRVMIAMALACDPKVLIADEPTTALDVMVQAQIIDLINELRGKMHMSMMIITHDLSIISETCDRIAVMYAGNIVEIGSVRSVIKESKHPYTQKLIAAFPNIYGKKTLIESIPGSPPNLLEPPSGCRFHLRCDKAMDVCKREVPVPIDFGNGHFAACHLLGGHHE
ncbi:ABC transporter ATP-binding protein [Acidaminobacter sp. JC074]|uniref:ABC transporter ATP-binding protein n=1 Tax=Acidaminobacter sp. JC074 TaxID=2530199 RepID=UPI001F0E6E87|nr:ABC transporter ATP-binding protein [Acidaminobacter sp. JC074]MCH4887472.1 ABC transporter ATP-binding protein [Acidaminobacter sp. JC074]